VEVESLQRRIAILGGDMRRLASRLDSMEISLGEVSTAVQPSNYADLPELSFGDSSACPSTLSPTHRLVARAHAAWSLAMLARDFATATNISRGIEGSLRLMPLNGCPSLIVARAVEDMLVPLLAALPQAFLLPEGSQQDPGRGAVSSLPAVSGRPVLPPGAPAMGFLAEREAFAGNLERLLGALTAVSDVVPFSTILSVDETSEIIAAIRDFFRAQLRILYVAPVGAEPSLCEQCLDLLDAVAELPEERYAALAIDPRHVFVAVDIMACPAAPPSLAFHCARAVFSFYQHMAESTRSVLTSSSCYFRSLLCACAVFVTRLESGSLAASDLHASYTGLRLVLHLLHGTLSPADGTEAAPLAAARSALTDSAAGAALRTLARLPAPSPDISHAILLAFNGNDADASEASYSAGFLALSVCCKLLAYCARKPSVEAVISSDLLLSAISCGSRAISNQQLALLHPDATLLVVVAATEIGHRSKDDLLGFADLSRVAQADRVTQKTSALLAPLAARLLLSAGGHPAEPPAGPWQAEQQPSPPALRLVDALSLMHILSQPCAHAVLEVCGVSRLVPALLHHVKACTPFPSSPDVDSAVKAATTGVARVCAALTPTVIARCQELGADLERLLLRID
jgi:hypothetical protein